MSQPVLSIEIAATSNTPMSGDVVAAMKRRQKCYAMRVQTRRLI